jgi:aromatic-L-amino-acid decarboxylase
MHPLEPSADEMRRLVQEALERIIEHIESLSLPNQPATRTRGANRLARTLTEPLLPEEGIPFRKLLDLLFRKAVPASINTVGPGYMAYIPGGGLFHAAVADLIADAVNRYTGIYVAAPALAQLEGNVLDWLRQIAGFPPEARGLLTSGGSMSNLIALVTARRERLSEEFLKGTLYVSDQAHHSLKKNAVFAGFPLARVREVPSDDRFRLRLDALEEQIAEDRRRGLTPFLVVGTAGTTNSGAVDPLPEIAEIARRHGLWFHVDGAYGGLFRLTDQGRDILRGMELADSLILDPHKSLFLPYGTGALLVRDGAALRRTHTAEADYMPAIPDDPALLDFSEMGPELTRPYRGLRLWLPIKLLGIAPFREALQEKLELARQAADEVRRMPGIEMVAEPELSLFAFRQVRPGLTGAALDRANVAFLKRINERKRVFLTGTRLGGRFALRMCVLSFRTHRERVAMAVEDIAASLAARG